LSEVAVRLAGADEGHLVAAVRRAWGETRGEVADEAFESAFDQWWSREHDQRLTWLALRGEDPVGMLNMLVFERMPMPGRIFSRWGYVANVFTLPAERDTGIGSGLLAACTSYADDQGFVRLVLSPSERSVPLYERAGFGPADGLMVRPGVE
jgi:GNAT superfamily N-acetyltransferase